jgi:hypothetical protein
MDHNSIQQMAKILKPEQDNVPNNFISNNKKI